MKTSDGRSLWNAGGWFGSQLGSTLWMLLAGLLALAHDSGAGLVVLGLFALPNVLGVVLWRRRDLSFYRSLQLFLAVTCGCALATVFVLDRAALWTRIQVGSEVSAGVTYWILLAVFGGLALMFHFRFRAEEAAS